MKSRKIELRQHNMYCSMCLLNVATVLSEKEGVIEFSIDLDNNTVTVKSRDGTLSRKEIRALINQALTVGATPCDYGRRQTG